jgi:predicted dehydrogenase
MVDGLVGEVTSITIRMTNRLWSVGSHAFDLLFYLSGEEPSRWRALEIPGLSERGEPAVDFVSYFPSGAAGRVLVHGPARLLFFEADVVGTHGRLTATGNGERLDYVPFIPSMQYHGYVVAGPAQHLHTTPQDESTFVSVVREAAAILRSGKQPNCTGSTALQSEMIMDQLLSRRSE